MLNQFQIQGHYWTILIYINILISLFSEISSRSIRKDNLSSILHKVYRNPYYFYNLNPTFNGPAFKLGITEIPKHYLVNDNNLFKFQIKSEHQLPQQSPQQLPQQFNYPKLFYQSLPSNDPLRDPSLTSNQLDHNSIFNKITDQHFKPINDENRLSNPLINLDRRNQLFNNGINLINENKHLIQQIEHQLDGTMNGNS